MIGGGQYTLAYRHIREQGPASLPRGVPIFTYIAVAPFIGTEEACLVANEGRDRRA